MQLCHLSPHCGRHYRLYHRRFKFPDETVQASAATTISTFNDITVTNNANVGGKVFASAYASNNPWYAEAPAGTVRMKIDDIIGNVGIGTIDPQYTLDVYGTVKAKEIIVNLTGCDYVFEGNYMLPTILERRQYTQQNKRLLYVSPAGEMQMQGAEIGATTMGILRNVEEHELYLYQQEKRIKELDNKVKELEKI